MGRQSISNSFTVNTVEDGENVCALDIDNEYDGVSTDASHKISAAKTVSTIVRLYDGGTEVDISSIAVNQGNGISVTGMPTSSVATFTSAAESGGFGKVLSWAFVSGQVMQASYSILITLTYNGTPYSATFTIVASEGGTSTYMADLDNEMDAIACSNVGTPLDQQDVSTTVSMWYGSSSRGMTISVYDTSSGGTQYNNGHSYINSQGISVAWNNDTGVITARFRKQYNNINVTLPEKKIFCIKIVSPNIENTGNIIRYLYFTVNCMRGAAVYQVVPSTNTITKHSDGSYTPVGTGNITCTVTKTIGGTTSLAPSGEYTLKMAVDGSSEIAYAAKRISEITSKIEYILYVPSGGSYVIDRETVPVITDGTDGTDGADGHDVNQNILIDTLNYKNDNNQWYALNSSLQSDLYNGQKIRYSNYNNRDSGKNYARTAEQLICSNSYGSIVRLVPNTWYTLSVYAKGSNGLVRLSLLQAGGYITSTIKKDGVDITITQPSDIQDVGVEFQLTNAWTRHSFSFKTKDVSSFTRTYAMYASIRLSGGSDSSGNPISLSSYAELYMSMPKLEAGEYATAYMANEDDLKGADGQNGQNGADGQDAANVVVAPTPIPFNANSDGSASDAQNIAITYLLYVNGTICTVTNASVQVPSNMSKTNVTTSGCTISIGSGVTPAQTGNQPPSVKVTLTGTVNNKSYTATANVALAAIKAGADGSRGKVGRAYYYAGEWDELADSFKVVVNDAQAPFFGYKPSGSTHGYYVLVRDQNGTFTKSQIYTDCGNPVAQSANWSKMADDQEYIITKAIFGEQAQFGGSIINQDWLMSVHGDVNVAWRRNTKIESYTSISAGNIYSPTWIGQFYAKTTGTHKFYINYECNGSPFTIILWDRSVESNNSIFSQYISSDGGAVNTSPYLYSGHQYLLCAYKSSSSNPNPVITNVTMDTPVPSGSTFPTGNYLYLDPMTGGAETILSDNEITVSTNSSIDYQTIVAYDMPLASLSSYYFYFELKGSNTTSRYVYWYLDRKENGSWVQRFSSDNNSRFTVNKADWTEYKFNLGFDSNAGGQYRLRIYASSSTVIMRKVSIAAGASFAPQFGVDLYRGTVSMNNVHVRGTIDAVDGNFSGTVNARLFYAKTCYVSGNYTINLETEPYYTYHSSNYSLQGTGRITLPNPSTYDGVELRFYCYFPTRSSAGTNIYYSGGIYTTDSGGFLSLYQTLSLKKNRFATVKAMRGYWYVVDDGVEMPDSNVPSIDPENPEIDEQE